MSNNVNVGAFEDSTMAPPHSSAARDADGGGSDDGSFDDLFDDPEENATSSFAAVNLPSAQSTKPSLGTVAPPKNAPPILDSDLYSQFSPNILMTAAIDGQIVLWDKRVNTPGTGVGRLWMGEKTPPWCISVSFFL